jgi:uncharacterized protein YjbJ (UPF0337 family)
VFPPSWCQLAFSSPHLAAGTPLVAFWLFQGWGKGESPMMGDHYKATVDKTKGPIKSKAPKMNDGKKLEREGKRDEARNATHRSDATVRKDAK